MALLLWLVYTSVVLFLPGLVVLFMMAACIGIVVKTDCRLPEMIELFTLWLFVAIGLSIASWAVIKFAWPYYGYWGHGSYPVADNAIDVDTTTLTTLASDNSTSTE